MNEFSKVLPVMELYPCRVLCHPGTDNCLLAAVHALVDSCIGSGGFFALLYLCQYVSVVVKKKKNLPLKDFLRMYLRSTTFGALTSAGTFISHCLLRRLLGKYYYYTVIFIPACIAGCSVFLESRKGQEFCINAFANCVLELWFMFLEQSNIIKWNANMQTIIFMVLSSLLSSLLSLTDFDLNYFWFFMPPKVKDSEESKGICFHKKKCWRHVFNLFAMYSTTGLVLQILRVFISNFNNPRLFWYFMKKPKAYKLAAFLGGYATLYQAIRCYLYQRDKKYSLIHDSLAGFLAGVVFRFQPTFPIFNSAIITTVQILAEAGCRRKILPNIPYLELMFILSCGILFHSRVLGSGYYPQLMVYVMSAVTHGKCDGVARTYQNILNNVKLRTST